MQWLLDIPLWLRLLVIFLTSGLVASLLNAAIYEFAYDRRRFSPWQPTPDKVGPRGWLDRVPVYGWLRLRRDRGVLGGYFWLRPMLLELFFPLAIAALYWWEVDQHALVEPQINVATSINWRALSGVLHAQFFAHAMLGAFMWAATFIDFDEKTIPDMITWPGTMLALVLVSAAPQAAMPDVAALNTPPPVGVGLQQPDGAPVPGLNGGTLYLLPVQPFSPNDWPTWATGRNHRALLLGLGCFWLWCFAVADRTWPKRLGRSNSWTAKLFVWRARLARDLLQCSPLREILIAGTLLTAMAWYTDGPAWLGLLGGLIGLVLGSAVVWAVRVVGSAAMGVEAMGFGDVTLMMMIGVLLGWQACLVLFFLAPFAGLMLGLTNLIFRGSTAIPYGPFLCLAAAATIARWGIIWRSVERFFVSGWLVPAVLVVCLVLLGLLLGMLQIVKGLFRPRSNA